MAIECYSTRCPFHGVREGLEGPFCYREKCILELATKLTDIAKNLDNKSDIETIREVVHILNVLADYCEYIPINEFIEYVKNGAYNEHDGTGYWVTDLYEEIERIDFDCLDPPENAAFVAWYAK